MTIPTIDTWCVAAVRPSRPEAAPGARDCPKLITHMQQVACNPGKADTPQLFCLLRVVAVLLKYILQQVVCCGNRCR
jgi:hypothetical protein